MFLVGQFTQAPAAVFAAPVAWLLFSVVAWLRFMFWPCPICGKPFHFKWWSSFTRGRECIHCGASRYE